MHVSTSISECNCNYCAHAAVCPNREIFTAFYENRDKIMVKCGNDDGSVDTSKQISVRVEHRYLDGPALSKIYKDLNLTNSGILPCMAAYGNCCPLKQPFDSPIYAPYPRAAGYIDNLCNIARDANGNRVPFVAQCVTPRTNEVHASPYTTAYPGLANQQWNCNSCQYASKCESAFDPNKLGGTQFSTFYVEYLDVDVGEPISIDSIAVPENVELYYERADSNEPVFTVTDEATPIIIYYTYAGEPPMPVPTYDSIDKLKELGMVHEMNFFYGPRSYVYPSLTSGTIVPMRVKMVAAIAETGRLDANGAVLAAPGQFIPFKQNGTGILKLDYANAYTLNESAVIQVFSNAKNVIDVSSADFQTCAELVEGDTILIELVFSKKWCLDRDMMKILSFGNLLQMENSSYTSGDYTVAYLKCAVPSDDFIIQTCLCDTIKMWDPVNYPVIDYETYWNASEVQWGLRPVATTQGNQIIMEDQPIPPRKWSKFVISDNMPYYATDCPPDDTCIVRPYFTLLGYTDDGEARASFLNEMPIFSAEEMEYEILQTNIGEDIQSNDKDTLTVHKAPITTYLGAKGRLYFQKDESAPDLIISGNRFLQSGENADNIAWAIWQLDFEDIKNFIADATSDIFTPTEKTGCNIIISDLTADPNTGEQGEAMLSVQQPISIEVAMPYQPNQALVLKDLLKGMAVPENFNYSLYRIPKNAVEITLWNSWPVGDDMSTEHEPTGTFICEDDSEIPMKSMHVSDDNDMDWLALDDLEAEYLLIVQPDRVYGMSSLYQNYMPYHLFVTAAPITTKATFIYDGSKVQFGQVCNLETGLRSYTLSNIYPEDAGLVKLDTSTLPLMTLTGDRAKFYALSNSIDRKCEQYIRVSAIYDNMRDNDREDAYAIPTGGHMYLPITPENPKHSVLRVEYRSESLEEPIVLYRIENGEIFFEEMDEPGRTQGYIRVNDDRTIELSLYDIGIDATINIVYHNGDDGTIGGCSRCRGYIDASQYPTIKWMPYCTDFAQS